MQRYRCRSLCMGDSRRVSTVWCCVVLGVGLVLCWLGKFAIGLHWVAFSIFGITHTRHTLSRTHVLLARSLPEVCQQIFLLPAVAATCNRSSQHTHWHHSIDNYPAPTPAATSHRRLLGLKWELLWCIAPPAAPPPSVVRRLNLITQLFRGDLWSQAPAC